MKKVLLFFLLLTSLSYSSQETLSIDDALNRVENDKGSYEFKKFQNSQEGTNIRIKDNKLGDFNGVTLSSGYNISENNFDNRPRKYDRTFQNKATYGPFFVNYNYVQSDRSYVSFGIEKNLKDVFYSKYNSNLKINNLQLELNQINYDKNMQVKKINLISLYQDILNTKNELEYRKKAYEHYRIDLNKLKKSYELGASPKINLESAELEAEDSKLQIDILETKLKSLYDVGKTDYNIDFENYKLLDFIENKESIDSLLNNYMEKEIIELRLNLSVAEEKKSYSNYDRYMPNLYLGYERVDRNLRGDRYYRDQDLFTIKFSKKLFSTDSEYKLNKLEVENLKNDLNEKIRTINAEKIKLKSEYNELLKLASIGDKKSDIAYKKYQIKEKEYELNKSSYLDVIDEYNKYLSQEIETKKAKNALNAFIYKIKIKR
ncbi:TolC family protein [Fusobacterium simiae]|uniref:TolC family protein n=1 Tax=Fusobacterium simiae TaxID=855 RepID=A0ABT4DFQ1_FUSSI|nr:TolC family protein [Fusobacterium simiae]MCY7007313.1 TolC family protein [Fusobacterium simiae]